MYIYGKVMPIARREKFFIIFAYPGVSGFLHIGHLRSYTYPDIIARYKRLRGFNVFFPAGLHASGLPTIGFSQRVARRDPVIIDHLKKHGVDEDTIKRLENPIYAIKFFAKMYIRTWRQMGITIDEDAFCTTIDEGYKRFIRWQMKKLEENGYLIRKPHYSPYCPNCGPIAVDPSETDVSKGGDASIIETSLVLVDKGDVVVPISIPDMLEITKVVVSLGRYYTVNVGGEKWLVHGESVQKFIWQKNGEVFEEVNAVEKVIGREISIGHNDIPVEYSKGKPWYGSGIIGNVKDRQHRYEKIQRILDFDREVVCRCGARVYIRPVPDQWFIRYSDNEIKTKAKRHIEKMDIVPEEYKINLREKIIDWYDDRPCSRKGRWLGTEWRGWIIEPISDSVIYPAYYIIAKYINKGHIEPKQLSDEVFDHVFLGHGDPEIISKKTKIPVDILKNMRHDFDYWYPVDLNCGGKEHKTVHFPVYIMAHIMIFPEKYWPRGIFVNWWVIGKRGKVSKSKGGAEPIPGLIERYGADVIRLFYVLAAEPYSDIVWDMRKLEKYKNVLEKIKCTIERLFEEEEGLLSDWLLSRLYRTTIDYIELMNRYELRKALMRILKFIEDIDWFSRRGGKGNRTVAGALLELLHPFIPFTTKELSERYGYNIVKISIKGRINEEAEYEEELLQRTIAIYWKLRKIFDRKGLKPKIVKIKTANKREKEIIEKNIEFLKKEFRVKVVVDETIKRMAKPKQPTLEFQF